MRQDWEPEDLLASWTLVEADWELCRTGPPRRKLPLRGVREQVAGEADRTDALERPPVPAVGRTSSSARG